MRVLHELTAVNFRSIESISLSPGPGINFVFGDNGAGKSSLLEAVDFLSRGRTFRTRLSRALIREGCNHLIISATLKDGRRLGAQRGRSGNPSDPEGAGNPGEGYTGGRIDGQEISSQAEMAAALPVITFHADAQRHVQSEARHWRNRLDWGVFHVKHSFRDAWKEYRRALRQRNELLRNPSPGGALKQWNRQMAERAETLDSDRSDYAGKLIAEVEAMATSLGFPLGIRYARGWADGKAFLEVLDEAEAGDRQVGYTRQGPHRATLRLFWEGMPASERASQGQRKSIAALLLLAQVRLFTALSGRHCVVLVDDLAAEFDAHGRRWLLEGLEGTRQQIFVTATDQVPGLVPRGEAKMFHMEHGRFSA